jgi:hydroxymethylglutaryl-CoA lyase
MAEVPAIRIVEEGMREGMQIESVNIPVRSKVELLDALSSSGLRNIVVGSFVSPKWVPQMEHVEEVIQSFTPHAGVNYTALALNARGVERRSAFVPPLSAETAPPRSMVHLCDVFVRRNANRSRGDEEAAVRPKAQACAKSGATEAHVGVNAAWGSNWLGGFDQRERDSAIQFQVDEWGRVDIPVTGVWLGDPMGWNSPSAVESQIRSIKRQWPGIRTFHLHLHNARGSAPISGYVAMKALEPQDTLIIDTSIGGMGGCPYCGHGRATQMIPTEDLVDLLEEEGIDTGIDLDQLIEAAHLAERVVGHGLYGHVSKAGRRPRGNRLYPMDMPLVESISEAQHFRLGRDVYAAGRRPWKRPITSPAREAIESMVQREESSSKPT